MTKQSAVRAPSGADSFARAATELDGGRPLRSRKLRELAEALAQGDAERVARDLADHLLRSPDDSDALNLLARTQVKLGRREEALPLLARALALVPGFALARYNYANLLFKLQRYEAALVELDTLLAGDAANPLFRQMKADVLLAMGEGEAALDLFRALAFDHPERAECRVNYGHALRATGKRREATDAYREAIALRPSYGLAYWSLANLKTVEFRDDEVARMQAEIDKPATPGPDRVYLGFALGKALEDRKAYAKSFEHYARANAAMRVRVRYDPEVQTGLVRNSKALFTPAFFAGHADAGAQAPDPIFVLSLPRSGSTLVEQILSSHPMIEGAGELGDIQALSRRLKREPDGYPGHLGALDDAEITALGEAYLESTRVHRKLGRPFFVDKKPANLHHVGLIHLILPNAKIVDVRRHPAACCLSGFKNHFTTARPNLAEFGRFYREYVELLAHFDRVLPGRIHRVIYEELVADPDAEVRKLLDYLGLSFDEACMRFYENRRSVLTPSSEQVRRPITAEAVDHWRNYEPWLGPLIKSLGSAMTSYPDVPAELR
ncbi:MAG TPA: sulfotransferase [Rhizomicrobium sp.]|nr:sulfotransferase [Rhizomicrobium sp.]